MKSGWTPIKRRSKVLHSIECEHEKYWLTYSEMDQAKNEAFLWKFRLGSSRLFSFLSFIIWNLFINIRFALINFDFIEYWKFRSNAFVALFLTIIKMNFQKKKWKYDSNRMYVLCLKSMANGTEYSVEKSMIWLIIVLNHLQCQKPVFTTTTTTTIHTYTHSWKEKKRRKEKKKNQVVR